MRRKQPCVPRHCGIPSNTQLHFLRTPAWPKNGSYHAVAKAVCGTLLAALLNGTNGMADGAIDFFDKHRDYMDLVFYDPSYLYVQYLREPGHHEGGQTEKAALDYLYVEADAALGLTSDTALYADIEYAAKRYDFDRPDSLNRSLGAPALYQIQVLTAVGHFFTEDLLAAWTFYPGISSDFGHDLDRQDFQWASGPIACYRLTPRFALHAGVQASVDDWRRSIYPVGGLSYLSADDRLHLNITAPFLLRVGYKTRPTTEYFAAAWYSESDYHAFLGPDDTDSRVRTSDVQVGCGVVWSFSRHLDLTLECGCSVANSFKVKEGAVAEQDGGSGACPYVAVALGARSDDTLRRLR